MMSSSCRSDECNSRRATTGECGMHFSIMRHSKEVLEMMNELRMSSQLCDITLRAESETFIAHRLVLASVSPYFNAMFCRGMKECCMMEVPLQGIKASLLALIIDYAYTSEIDICESNVCSLLPIATMFQMSHVVEACCTFLEHQLDPSNCIGIADFAHAYGCQKLYSRAREYIYEHFSEVSKSEEFLQLSQSQVIQVIKRDEVNVKCESEVYDAVIRWVRHDEEKRCAKLESLLRAVRCHYLTPCFLQSQLSSCRLLQKVPQCIDYLNCIFNDLRLHKCCKEKRRTCNSPPAIYIIGGYLRHSLSSVDCWNPETQQWYKLANLPMPRSGVAACQVQGFIYVIGGRNNSPDGNTDSSSVDCFDPLNNVWTRRSDMLVARNRVGIGAIDGLIYAVGGSQSRIHHNSVERYDPHSDRWSYIAQMATPRIGVGVATVNRLLYAVGGYDGTNRLSSVECYTPEEDKWKFIASMNVSRSGAGVCSFDQHIYVVGGYDSTNQLQSVERYNIETQQWQMISMLNRPRSALCLAVVNCKIYAIGGYDGTHFLSGIECYDREDDRWTEVTNMMCGRSGHGVAIGIEPSREHAVAPSCDSPPLHAVSQPRNPLGPTDQSLR